MDTILKAGIMFAVVALAVGVPLCTYRLIPSVTPAVVDSRAMAPPPPPLPLSIKDVPLTPELEGAYQQLKKEYGPMYNIFFDTTLARLADLATCGIKDTGAVWVEVRASADPDPTGKTQTMTTHSVRITHTSFTGKVAETVTECVQNALLHRTEKAVLEGPNGRQMDPDSEVDFEFIDFPIETDGLYDFLRTGALASLHHTASRKKYGF